MWKEALKNSSIVMSGVILSRACVFLFNLVIIRQLSVADYARFSFALAVFNWVLVFSHFDLYAAISRQVSRLRALGAAEEIASNVRHARLLVAGFSSLGIVVAYLIASRQEYQDGYLLLFLVALVPMALLTINDGYLKGCEKFSSSAVVEIGNGLSKLVVLGCTLILFGKLTLNLVFVVFMVACVAAFVFSSYQVGRVPVSGKTSDSTFNKKTAGELLNFSKWVCLTDLMNAGILLCGNLILSFYSPDHLARFNLVVLLYSVFQIGFGALTTVLIPQVSRKAANNEEIRLLGWREFLSLVAVTMVMVLALFFFPFQQELLTLLFDKPAYADSLSLLAILLLAFPFRAMTMTNKGVLQGLGRPDLIAMVSVVTLFVSALLFWGLYLRYELTGALAGMAIAYLVEFLLTAQVAMKVQQQRRDGVKLPGVEEECRVGAKL